MTSTDSPTAAAVSATEEMLGRARHLDETATRGPWTWASYRYGTDDLMGRDGEPGVYEWDTEVVEASHNGGCGCRQACDLELTISDADKAMIAESRTLLPQLEGAVRAVLGLEPVTLTQNMSQGDRARAEGFNEALALVAATAETRMQATTES